MDLELLEEIQPLHTEQLARRGHINTLLLGKYSEEEDFWHKRSSENWILKGDNNTEFFHRIANGRRRKNVIFSLQHLGQQIRGTPELLNHATHFYKELFGPAEGFHCHLREDMWIPQEQLSDAENIELNRPFDEEEIKYIIESMEKNKAAGPDGFPIEFYQQCWPIIKDDMVKLFADFDKNKVDLSRINYGIITLIPKGAEADVIQKYRPICLLQVLFKFFFKGLTLRLGPLMPKLINNSQNAFIKGRNIMDGILSLHEILRETKYKKKQGVVLKLDFEKAYDKVNWDFLFHCVHMKKFTDKWKGWIKGIVTNGTLSVKVNEQVGPYFGSHKGVRQGDPLSPLWFNLAAECLAKMTKDT